MIKPFLTPEKQHQMSFSNPFPQKMSGNLEAFTAQTMCRKGAEMVPFSKTGKY